MHCNQTLLSGRLKSVTRRKGFFTMNATAKQILIGVSIMAVWNVFLKPVLTSNTSSSGDI